MHKSSFCGCKSSRKKCAGKAWITLTNRFSTTLSRCTSKENKCQALQWNTASNHFTLQRQNLFQVHRAIRLSTSLVPKERRSKSLKFSLFKTMLFNKLNAWIPKSRFLRKLMAKQKFSWQLGNNCAANSSWMKLIFQSCVLPSMKSVKNLKICAFFPRTTSLVRLISNFSRVTYDPIWFENCWSFC